MIACGDAIAPAWPEPFTPSGVRGHAGQRDIEIRQVLGARQCIVHERAAEHLAGVRIVYRVLEHRLADTLSDAALHLSHCQHRIDQRAEVVDRSVTFQRDRAGVRIDLHFRDVAAIRECNQVEQVPDIRVQTWRHTIGQVGRIACRTGNREQIDAAIRFAANREASIREHHLLR
jgi:hypothetical protein